MCKGHVLVIDDEKEICDLVEIYLKREGYEVTKRYNANNIEQDIIGKDLTILDIMMPGINGLEACAKIRENYNIPIIMLSAKSRDIDKIKGLNVGADDYVAKPFNPLELVARVNSQIRRLSAYKKQEEQEIILIRDLEIDTKKHIVKLNDEVVNLTPTEFDILVLLCQSPNIVFSMEEIFEKVWKEKYFDSNNTVMVHIRKLREKIEKDPRHPNYIITVWGVGYKVEA